MTTDLITDGLPERGASALDHRTPGSDQAPEPGDDGDRAPAAPRPPGAERVNGLEQFDPAITAVRWATTGVSVALASPVILDGDVVVAVLILAVLANTVIRTLVPLRDERTTTNALALGGDAGLHLVAIAVTGHWESPLILLAINAVVIAGFGRGFRFALNLGVASALVLTVTRYPRWDPAELTDAAQWSTFLLLSAIVAGYARRISGEASRRHSLALDRVARLADANSILVDLHEVAQSLPASLDLDDVLTTTLARLRTLLDHDSAAIILREDTDGTLRVAEQRGMALPAHLGDHQLPAAARRALATSKLVPGDGSGTDGEPLTPRSRSALYAPLLARGRLIGLVAVESRAPQAFSPRDERALAGFVEPAALAIDNARLFRRIRTVGADEERNRIARDLHDRIGQSLAYVAFQVDALIRHDREGRPLADELASLRTDMRDVIVEVRDTLSHLRTDVSDSRDFAETAEAFAAHLSERSGLSILLDCDTERRIPLLQEREMWRIAQEAMVNAERHAGATELVVRWHTGPSGTLLEVTDNGQGLPERSRVGQMGRSDSYGLVGMRERADSVGASLELLSKPGEGTTVRCFLPTR